MPATNFPLPSQSCDQNEQQKLRDYPHAAKGDHGADGFLSCRWRIVANAAAVRAELRVRAELTAAFFAFDECHSGGPD